MTDTTAPPFGQRLALALARAQKSRKEIAEHLGVSVQSIGQVLKGPTVAMTADNSARSARFLGVSAFWLATGEGAMAEDVPSTPFRDLNAFEGQLVEMFRQLSHDRQHDYLIELSNEVNQGAVESSRQNPFAGAPDRRHASLGRDPERRSAVRHSDSPASTSARKRGAQ